MQLSGNNCHIHLVTGIGEENNHPLFTNNIINEIREEFKRAISNIGNPNYSFGNLPAVMLDDIPTYKVNKEIKTIIEKFSPNTVFIPSCNDLHLDHRIINYAAKVACRPYLQNNKNLSELIEYEVPSETNIYYDKSNQNFSPNLYLDIENAIDFKLKAFSEYKSQMQDSNLPRSLRGIKTLAAYRGSNIGKEFAEAYEIVFKKV